MKNILINGAWLYANNLMHIGHLAALMPGDILARYFRLINANVLYVSGTDCHGTPITERALKENVAPNVLANKYHEEFKKVYDALDFTFDLYAKTSDEFHKENVKEFFLDIYENGYLYEKEENEDYCPNCSKFLSDREIIGTCPKCNGIAKGDQCDSCLSPLNALEIKDKKHSLCNTKTTYKLNKHLYFKLSAFQSNLEKYLENAKDIWRKNAYSETKKFLDMGLIDRAATRQLNWGIDLPIDGFEDKKIYVWFEAVMGYLTDVKKLAQEKGFDFTSFITDPNLDCYCVHGKDNIVFHTIIYPALLMAIGKNYTLPKYMISSEFLNMNDEKMSKSLGNLITVEQLLQKFDKDTIRYYFIINNPEKKDVNFSLDDITQTHNKFLVGVLGNFINRNLSFVYKKFDGVIKKAKINENIINITKELYKQTASLIEKGELKEALSKIMNYVSIGNKYYDENEPWIKAKEDIESFNEITYTCVYIMTNLKNLLYPFIPKTASLIKEMLSLDNYKWEEEKLSKDIKIEKLQLLFNRIDN